MATTLFNVPIEFEQAIQIVDYLNSTRENPTSLETLEQDMVKMDPRTRFRVFVKFCIDPQILVNSNSIMINGHFFDEGYNHQKFDGHFGMQRPFPNMTESHLRGYIGFSMQFILTLFQKNISEKQHISSAWGSGGFHIFNAEKITWVAQQLPIAIYWDDESFKSMDARYTEHPYIGSAKYYKKLLDGVYHPISNLDRHDMKFMDMDAWYPTIPKTYINATCRVTPVTLADECANNGIVYEGKRKFHVDDKEYNRMVFKITLPENPVFMGPNNEPMEDLDLTPEWLANYIAMYYFSPFVFQPYSTRMVMRRENDCNENDCDVND